MSSSREALAIDIAEPKVSARFVYKRYEASERSAPDVSPADPARFIELNITPAQRDLTPISMRPAAIVSESDFFGGDFRSIKLTNLAAPAAFVALLSGSVLSSGVSDETRGRQVTLIDALTPADVSTTTIGAAMSALLASSEVSDAQMASASKATAKLRVSSKIIADVLARVASDPTSPAALSARSTVEQASVVQASAIEAGWAQGEMSVSDGDFALVGSAKIQAAGLIINRSPAAIEQFVPIAREALYRDTAIAYGETYRYTVVTLCKVSAPAKSASGEVGWLTFWCTSSGTVIDVTCIDTSPPPPPSDFSVAETSASSAVLTWSFPVNTQRDIVAFQVYKRKKTSQPFTLLAQLGATPTQTLVLERALRELDLGCMYTDAHYERGDIYAIASVDAHGMTSGYSSQLMMTIKRGAVSVSRISAAGCPKAYPNLYIALDPFPDIITSNSTSKMRLRFTPDCIAVSSGGKKIDAVLTHPSAMYVLQVTSLSAQRAVSLRVKIADRRAS